MGIRQTHCSVFRLPFLGSFVTWVLKGKRKNSRLRSEESLALVMVASWEKETLLQYKKKSREETPAVVPVYSTPPFLSPLL